MGDPRKPLRKKCFAAEQYVTRRSDTGLKGTTTVIIGHPSFRVNTINNAREYHDSIASHLRLDPLSPVGSTLVHVAYQVDFGDGQRGPHSVVLWFEPKQDEPAKIGRII